MVDYYDHIGSGLSGPVAAVVGLAGEFCEGVGVALCGGPCGKRIRAVCRPGVVSPHPLGDRCQRTRYDRTRVGCQLAPQAHHALRCGRPGQVAPGVLAGRLAPAVTVCVTGSPPRTHPGREGVRASTGCGSQQRSIGHSGLPVAGRHAAHQHVDVAGGDLTGRQRISHRRCHGQRVGHLDHTSGVAARHAGGTHQLGCALSPTHPARPGSHQSRTPSSDGGLGHTQSRQPPLALTGTHLGPLL